MRTYLPVHKYSAVAPIMVLVKFTNKPAVPLTGNSGGGQLVTASVDNGNGVEMPVGHLNTIRIIPYFD